MQNVSREGQVAAGLTQYQKRHLTLEGAMKECFCCTYQIMTDLNSRTRTNIEMISQRAQKLRTGSHRAEQRADLMKPSPHKRWINGNTEMTIISRSEASHTEI